MPTAKLTARSVAAFQGVAGKETHLWDTEIKGLGLKVNSSGKKTYIYKFRTPDGRQRKRKLGDACVIPAEAARRSAIQILADKANGIPLVDPNPKPKSISVSTMCDLYLDDYAIHHKKAKSVEEDERYIESVIKPNLGKKALCDVSRVDIVKLHRSMSDKPYKANRVLSLISKMFNLAESWEYRAENSNPTRHIKKYKEEARERFLSRSEIKILNNVIDDAERNRLVSQTVIDVLRVLLMTGCRLREALTMKWAFVDLENGIINLPDSKTGKKTIWLSDKAIRYFSSINKKQGNPFVFPGQRHGTHLVNVQKPWRKIREKAGLNDVRIHDLRHTYASLAVAQNLSLPIVGKLLGHKSSKSTERYAHLYSDVMAAAARIVAEES